jgi:hypothetical protein
MCVSQDRPAKHAPVLAGDYVKMKLEASYKQGAALKKESDQEKAEKAV